MAKPFDVTTKELVEMYPEDWVQFLGLPDAPLALADADLSTFSPEADKVVRVNDPKGAYILHIEFQASYDSTLDARILRYHVLLRERFGLPVISVVFLLRPEAEGEGVTGRIVETTPQGMNSLNF